MYKRLMTRDKQVLLQNLLCYFIFSIFALTPGLLFAQRDFYTPKSLIIPLHDQKNQLHVSVGGGGGYDLNISYAFTDKFALFHTATFDNGSKRRITILGDRYNVDRNDYVLKGGLGYFFKAKKKEFSIMEVYAGAGLSNIDNYWYYTGETDGEFTQARYWTVFGQFNSGKKIRRSELALGLRLAYSQYTNFRFYSNHPNMSYIKCSYENPGGLTVDPVASYSYVLKGFKLNAQVGWAIPLSFSSVQQTSTDDYSGTVVSSEAKFFLWSVLGRLSVQYNFNLGNRPWVE